MKCCCEPASKLNQLLTDTDAMKNANALNSNANYRTSKNTYPHTHKRCEELLCLLHVCITVLIKR